MQSRSEQPSSTDSLHTNAARTQAAPSARASSSRSSDSEESEEDSSSSDSGLRKRKQILGGGRRVVELKTNSQANSQMETANGFPLPFCGVLLLFVKLIGRVGQNHTFIGIYSVHTVFLAGKSPYIRSYTVHIYGSGQPYLLVLNRAKSPAG